MPPSPPRRPDLRGQRSGSPRRPAAPGTGAEPAPEPSVFQAKPAAPPEAPEAMGGADPLIGRVIAGHQIVQRLASSRLCCTYKAQHAAMERTVSFKALTAEADPGAAERFDQTARHSAQLHHANIASIYDVGSEGGVHFCTMEHIEGHLLSEILQQRQKIPSADAIRVAIDVADALRHANTRGVPGWRLSAGRIMLSARGEVKLLPPTFTRPGTPVLDDAYVMTAIGAILYAMLSGGRVRDLESALEPGASAPAKLPKLRTVAPATPAAVAQAVERLTGIAGEPFPNVGSAISALRSLLASKEQLETRTRAATERVKERGKRARTWLYVAIGSVGAVAAILVLAIGSRAATTGAGEKRFAEAATQADGCFKACKDAQKQFAADPTDANAQQVLKHLEAARAAYQGFLTDYPNHPKANAAQQNIQTINDAIRKFTEDSKQDFHTLAGLRKVQEVDRAFEKEVADRIEKGGSFDVEAWSKRYFAVAREFSESVRVADRVKQTVSNLPKRARREQMKIDTNAVARKVEQEFLPKLQYQQALDAWQAYLSKYSAMDAFRKDALENYDSKTTMLRRAAQVKYAELNNQALFHIKREEHDKARDIYQRIVDNFGIRDYVDRAKAEIEKLPKK